MDPKNKVDNLMKEKFLCQARFAEEIEKLVKTYNFNYIDSITVKGKTEPVKVYTINN